MTRRLNPDGTCLRCGLTHTRCAAHSKRNANQPCMRHPVPGADVCTTHGGAAPQVQAAANTRLTLIAQKDAMTQALALAYPDGNPPEIDPAEAMLYAVSAKYAQVRYYAQKVAEVADNDSLSNSPLVWGITRHKDGGDDEGTTREAKPNVWLALHDDAMRDLVKFAAAARAAGCDEARVRIAEGQGALVADVLRAVLDRMLDALTSELVELGLHQDVVIKAITAAWGRWVADIVPAELRRLGGAA